MKSVALLVMSLALPFTLLAEEASSLSAIGSRSLKAAAEAREILTKSSPPSSIVRQEMTLRSAIQVLDKAQPKGEADKAALQKDLAERQQRLESLEQSVQQLKLEMELLQMTDAAARTKKRQELQAQLEDLGRQRNSSQQAFMASSNELRNKYFGHNTAFAAALTPLVTMAPADGPFKGLKATAVAPDFTAATGSVSWRTADHKTALSAFIRLLPARTQLPATATEKLDNRYPYSKQGDRGLVIHLKSADVIYSMSQAELATPENLLVAARTLVNLAELDKLELTPAASVPPAPRPLPPEPKPGTTTAPKAIIKPVIPAPAAGDKPATPAPAPAPKAEPAPAPAPAPAPKAAPAPAPAPAPTK